MKFLMSVFLVAQASSDRGCQRVGILVTEALNFFDGVLFFYPDRTVHHTRPWLRTLHHPGARDFLASPLNDLVAIRDKHGHTYIHDGLYI